jgi:hypothetical protein
MSSIRSSRNIQPGASTEATVAATTTCGEQYYQRRQ